MNTLEATFSRHSVRSYTGESITEEELQTILKAANAAPVGMAKYDTVHLTVIKDKELLQQIDHQAAQFFGDLKIHPLYGAPMLVLISATQPTGNVSFSNTAIIAHNMALAAAELKVGACYIWGAVAAVNGSKEVLEKLRLPQGFEVCCGVILGKTTEVYEEREIPQDRIQTTYL